MRFQYQIDDFNAPDWTDIEASCDWSAAMAAAEIYDADDLYLASNEASIEVKIRCAEGVGKDESAVEGRLTVRRIQKKRLQSSATDEQAGRCINLPGSRRGQAHRRK